MKDRLEAVREGRWKLHVHKEDTVMTALYDLERDIGEQSDLAQAHPDVVERLQGLLDACRKDIGDAVTGVTGENKRPAGRVANPDTLTHYHPDHPYMHAMYDKGDAG
jgi:hypothetical protein